MRPEESEILLVKEIFNHSKKRNSLLDGEIVSVEKLTGDASTRKYFRIFLPGISFVVCLGQPSKESKNPFLDIQKFLFSHRIPVPQIWDVDLEKGYFLEEDLGDKTLLTLMATVESAEQEKSIYMRVIEDLVKMHSLKSGAEDVLNGSFDEKKFMDEILFTIKFFLRGYLGFQDDKVLGELESLFQVKMSLLASRPMVLTQRDFNTRNIMIRDSNPFYIDFQDARWGIPQYDLCSLLEDCYYDFSNGNREFLKNHYYELAKSKNIPVGTKKEFNDFYDLCSVQRIFKAIGSFSYIYALRKDLRYLKYIGFGMEKLRLIMHKHEDFTQIRKILFEIYYAH